MRPINSKEYNAMPSLNTSRPNSKVCLQSLKNEYLMQYPQQPRESYSLDVLPFEVDSRDAQLTNRILTSNMNKLPIVAESVKMPTPLKLIKFIQKMRINNTSFTKNAFVKALLLDKIFDGNLELYHTLLQAKKKSFLSYKSIKFPFNRYGCFRSAWKVFLKFIYLSIVLFSPLILLHEGQVLEQLLLIQLITIIFNSVLNLHTCYYYNDVEVTNLKAIQLNYIRQKGVSDFCMSISLCLILQLGGISQWITIALIVILCVCATQKLKLRCSFDTVFNFEFFQKIFEGIIYCHIFSIIYLALKQQPNEFQQYLVYFYKYIQNYLLIQSDFEYETKFELILGIIIETLFFINKIGLVLQLVFTFNKNVDYFNYRNDYYHLKAYLSHHNVNRQLAQLALHNYKFQTTKEMSQSNTIIHSRLMKLLTFNIQQKIDRMVKTVYFQQIGVFKKFSLNTQEKIIDSMQFQKIEANEIIINQNLQDDQSLYLIKKGQVKLCYNGNNKKQVPLKILKDYDVFGEVSFFSGLTRTCTIMSLGPVQLFKISRVDFLNAIKGNGQDLEIACMIRDQIQFDKRFDKIELQCLCCNSSQHLIHSCQYLTYRPDNERVLSQYLFDHKQERNKIKRPRMRSYNSRFYMFQLNLVGEEFQENNFKEEDSKILKDFTSNNQNQLSFTGVQQQKRQSFNKVADICLVNDLEDSRDQFQEIVQLVSRKQSQNRPLQEIIQELDSSDSNGSSPRNVNEQQLQTFNFKQQQIIIPEREKLQDQFNSNFQKSAHSLGTPLSNGYDQISRKSKQSLSQINKEKVPKPKQSLATSYFGEDLEKNFTDPESIYRKANKLENTHQFYVFSNTVINQEEFYFSIQSFEKSYNFTYYYPYFNPNYLFYMQYIFNVKVQQLQKQIKQAKVTQKQIHNQLCYQ